MPQQIYKIWDSVRPYVELSFPPTVGEDESRYAQLLEDLLKSRAHIFLAIGVKEGLLGFLVTNFTEDHFTKFRSLQILVLYGFKEFPQEMYHAGFDTLCKFALLRRCCKITSLTNNQKLLQVARLMGGDTSYTFIELNIKPTY